MIISCVYRMTPRSATVGVATADPNAYNEIMAAIATNNIDHVRNVAAALAAAAAPPVDPAVDPAAVPAPGTPAAGNPAPPPADPAVQTPPAQAPEAPPAG